MKWFKRYAGKIISVHVHTTISIAENSAGKQICNMATGTRGKWKVITYLSLYKCR